MALRFRDWYVFMRQPLKILNAFNTFPLKPIFSKTFFKKLEYDFLVESTKIEKTAFPYKIALSEAKMDLSQSVDFM